MAGLVEGRRTAGMPVAGNCQRVYSASAVAPLVKMCVIFDAARRGARSFGRTFLMLASDEPSISPVSYTHLTLPTICSV